jgi:hypothetical protein
VQALLHLTAQPVRLDGAPLRAYVAHRRAAEAAQLLTEGDQEIVEGHGTIPDKRPSLRIGMRRTPRVRMVATTCSRGSDACAVIAGELMMAEASVASGSRPGATARITRSRSVPTPAGSPASPVTTTQPTVCSRIASATSRTGAPLRTHTTSPRKCSTRRCAPSASGSRTLGSNPTGRLGRDDGREPGDLLREEPHEVVGGDQADGAFPGVHDGEAPHALPAHVQYGLGDRGVGGDGHGPLRHRVLDARHRGVAACGQRLEGDVAVAEDSHGPLLLDDDEETDALLLHAGG